MVDRKILLIVAFIIPAGLFGQRVSISAGIGTSNLYTVDKGQSGLLPNYQYSFSYSFDFNWWAKLSDKLSVTSGMGLANISTTYENPLNIMGQQGKKEQLNLLYVKLPVRLNFIVNKFIPYIGPSFRYQIRNEVKDYLGYHHLYASKFDYGLDLGFGIKLTPRIIGGINFYNGFGNAEKIECGNCTTSKSEVSRVRAFDLNLSYTLIR
jgi:hypothetical protein